jgi:hypothetical protein
MPPRQHLKTVSLCALAVALGAAGFATAAPEGLSPNTTPVPTPPPSGEMALVFSQFQYAVYPGMEQNCPTGYENTNSEAYLASLPAAERTRLSKPENEQEFARLWKASVRGPNNTNICTNFDQFPQRALQKTVQGKVSYGLDLDGGSPGPDTCVHENFLGPHGEKGIDNQGFRAMGCMRMWRGVDGTPGDFIKYQQEWLRTGEYTNVLRLRGVDSLVDDDDVEVVIASSLDAPIVDAQQRFVAGATFQLTTNPRWRNVLRGRIRAGVLTTEPHKIVLRQPVHSGDESPRFGRNETIFEKGRLRLTFDRDGSVKGIIGGYTPLIALFERSAAAGVGATDIVNYDCASSYNTLKKLADGGRDPKTGQCTTISTAFEVAAIPAYLVDKMAGASTGSPHTGPGS